MARRKRLQQLGLSAAVGPVGKAHPLSAPKPSSAAGVAFRWFVSSARG